jgi:hypothetical protein
MPAAAEAEFLLEVFILPAKLRVLVVLVEEVMERLVQQHLVDQLILAEVVVALDIQMLDIILEVRVVLVS